jgi:phenylalanyl-tRNA synthetase alpha chain
MASETQEETLLRQLSSGPIGDTWEYAARLGLDHQAVVGTLKSLEAEKYVSCSPIVTEFWQLTEEAESYMVKGSPEAQVFAAVPAEGGVDEAGLKAALGDELVKIGMGKCIKNKWLARDKASGRMTRLVRDGGRGPCVRTRWRLA